MPEGRIFIPSGAVLGEDLGGHRITSDAALKDPDLITGLDPATITRAGLQLFADLVRSVRVKHVFNKRG